MLFLGLLGLIITPALPLAVPFPLVFRQASGAFTSPVGFVAHQCLRVVKPLARELGRDHFISGPRLYTTEMECSLALLATFQEPNILERFYSYPTKPIQSIWEISPWLLPEQG